jgi:iron(III) transport system permease protein
MEVLNDFGAVQHFGVDTFTTGIYRTWLGMRESAAAAQLAAILMLFVFAVLLLERWSRGQRRFSHTTGRYRPLPSYRLGGVRAAGAILACALPMLLGFCVPAAALAVWCAQTAGEWVDARFVQLLGNSLLLALLAAVLAVLLALLLAYAARLRRGRMATLTVRLAGMGYAVPGSVIAVGVMLPFGWLDNRVDAIARETLGISTGLLLSGTLVAVVFAYLVRFMALSLTAVEAGLGKITPSMEQASRTLGLSPLRTLARVHAPMLRGSALTAALLVFVDVMKELPATLVLRPFNFGTLATHTYELATDEFLREASSSALAIVAVGIAPVVLLSLAIARSRPGQAGT